MTETEQLKMQSDSIGKLAEALAKAQGAMEGAKKDRLNPHFKSSYADLASVWDACREPLSQNGLAVTQQVTSDANGVTVVSTLLHSSGEYLRDRCWLPVAQKTPQGYGSTITYARRYSLAALVGVAQEDDDGEAGTRGNGSIRAVRAPAQESAKTAKAPTQSGAVKAAGGITNSDMDRAGPPPVESSPFDPMEEALALIQKAKTAQDMSALTEQIIALGVSKEQKFRDAYAARLKALKGAA